MWRKISFISWYTVVGMLVLAAILVSIVRGYPSIYQQNLLIIQGKISSIIDRPVHVENMHLEWYGYTPHITVNNLSIYSDDAKQDQLLFVKKALLSIDLYKSLINKKFAIQHLSLIGSNLETVRTKNQRILLNGIDISERIAKRKKLDTKSKIHISLLESTIAIKDEVKNLDYFFDRVDIAISFEKDRFKVTSNFLLPETLGNSLVVVADVKDLDQGLNNVSGTLYTKGKDINLNLLDDFFPQLQVGIKTGNSDFEVWGNFKSELERSFKGKLNIRDLVYNDVEKPLNGIVAGQEITALETQFQIEGTEDNWHLALINSDIQTADKKWLGNKYEIKCTDCGRPEFSIETALDYVDLTHLFSTFQHFQIFSVQLEKLLAKTQINGVLHNSRILTRWHDKQLIKFSYESSIQDATVSIPSQEFVVSSLNGEMNGNHLQGSIEIDADGIDIQAKEILDHSFQDQKIVGAVKWKRSNDGVIVALENISLLAEGLSANLQGSIQINNGKPYIDLQGEIPYAELATIKAYMPYKKMRPKLVKWLKASINSGTLKNGKLLFQGNPKHFPFKDQPGVFAVVASVEDGALDYRKDWPSASNINAEFEIKNKHLVVNGHQGTILNSSINQVTATIDDIKLPRLKIDGKASGPASDILDFLRKSSLIPVNSQIPKHISADGITNLDLNLILTLTKKLEKERLVNGVIEFDNTNLTITSASLPFTNLKGKLKFNRQGAEGQGLTAKLFGSAFNADAINLEDGRTRLMVTGDFDFDTYMATNYEQASKFIKGTSPVSATISLPRFGKHVDDKSLDINIDSNLEGLLVSLPEPFHKEIDEHKPFSVHTKYQAGKGYPLFVSFDNEVFLQAALSEDGKKISAVELRMGNDRFDLPTQGLKVSGSFDQLNVTAWQDVFQSPSKTSELELSEIDIKANSVAILGLEIKNIDFQLNKDAQYWMGKINSSIAKGNFNYPRGSNSTSIATGKFDHLRFSKPEKEITVSIDPRNLPALEVYSKQLEFNGYSFNDVALKTKSSPTGMIINSLTGIGEDLQITANGTWEVGVDEKQSTSLDIILVTQNLHNSLTGLGFETGATKGQGSVTAKLNWPKSPYQFSVGSFLGTANLRFKDGEISSVDPGGAGRIIGLVNLSEISRRLSLDFKDFFSKGYVFDKIRGDLVFQNANLTTENLTVKGPSADILIEGRTGILAKDYDQVVTVTPRVSGGLPWIGLAVGGPLGAVGVIVGEKVAKTIGIDVNKVTEVKYSMTGSWDDPQIEPIAQKVVKASPSIPGQTSPQQLPSNQTPQESKIITP